VTARRLLGVFGGPVAWTLHLLASYAVVAAGCATSWSGIVPALVAITIACAAASAAAGVVAWRDRDDTEPTFRMLATIGFGLAVLFFGVIVLGGAVPAVVALC
jgi:hypothetical protein